MPDIKILISDEASAGKTTLIKTITDALSLSHDDEKPAVKVPPVVLTIKLSFQTVRK